MDWKRLESDDIVKLVHEARAELNGYKIKNIPNLDNENWGDVVAEVVTYACLQARALHLLSMMYPLAVEVASSAVQSMAEAEIAAAKARVPTSNAPGGDA